ncbi:MAG: Panacea domain-containing protein [Sphingomonadaceae bacterium]
MAYHAATVANRFIELAEKDGGRRLTPMQLIKLAYIAHGFSLAIKNRPLLDEPVEAWRYGPVIPSLYQKLKSFGNGGVDRRISSIFVSETLASEDVELIDAVYGKYGNLTGGQLSFLTHKKGTPWSDAYTPGEFGIALDDSNIRRHYADLMRGVGA